MHGFTWTVTKVDEQGGSLEEVCGCGCGVIRWRGLSPSDPSVQVADGDAPQQKWRDGPRPDNVDVSSLT